MITIFIDNNEIKTKPGNNLLWTALDNNLYIPNLCANIHTRKQNASCRLCFVEIDSNPIPVTACTIHVHEKMTVSLNTPKVINVRNTAFKLLLSNHHLECRNCKKNKNCELQKIAGELGLRLKIKELHNISTNLPIDISHPEFYFDRNKCVLCGKCIWACNIKGNSILDYAFRGNKTIVTTFRSIPLSEAGCTSCFACVEICPVGALCMKK